MSRLVCVILGGVFALPFPRISAAAPGPGAKVRPAARAQGKVVRVERTRGAPSNPRVCDVRADHAGTCLGTQPVIGEIVTVLDESGVLAEMRITEAIAFSTGSANSCQSLWTIKTELVRGDLASSPMRAIGVVDAEVHPRHGRVLPKDQFPAAPSGHSDDVVVVAVDRDGDRAADLVLTQSRCDGGNPIPGGSCLDTWSRINGRMIRVQQTNLATCGF